MTAISLSSTAAKYASADLDAVYKGSHKIWQARDVKPFNLLQQISSVNQSNYSVYLIWWTDRPAAPVHEYSCWISYTGNDNTWIWVGGAEWTDFSDARNTSRHVVDGKTYYRHWQRFVSATPAVYWKVQLTNQSQVKDHRPVSGQLMNGDPHPRCGSPIDINIPIAFSAPPITLDINPEESDIEDG